MFYNSFQQKCRAKYTYLIVQNCQLLRTKTQITWKMFLHFLHIVLKKCVFKNLLKYFLNKNDLMKCSNSSYRNVNDIMWSPLGRQWSRKNTPKISAQTSNFLQETLQSYSSLRNLCVSKSHQKQEKSNKRWCFQIHACTNIQTLSNKVIQRHIPVRRGELVKSCFIITVCLREAARHEAKSIKKRGKTGGEEEAWGRNESSSMSERTRSPCDWVMLRTTYEIHTLTQE